MQVAKILSRCLAALIVTLAITAHGQGVKLTPRDRYDEIPTRTAVGKDADQPGVTAAETRTQRDQQPASDPHSRAPGIDRRWGDENNEIQLPVKFDLLKYLPEPGDQGKTNSCVAWTVAYAAYTCQICQERDRAPTYPADIFSPDFIYRKLKEQGEGLLVIDAITYVRQHGCASQATMAGDEAAQQYTDVEAKTYCALRNARAVDLRDIKTYIYQGYPVILLVELDEAFKSKEPSRGNYLWSRERSHDYHAVCAVGYDDEKQAVLIMNSWRTDWKDGGYCWAAYENFREINDQNWCAEAHVIGIKQCAPYTASIYLGRSRRGRIQRRLFKLQGDHKIYEDDEVISPPGWQLDDIACDSDSLYALDLNQAIYRLNGDDSWTHLSRGKLAGKQVTMMAANESIPLHVLTAEGKLYHYDSNSAQWSVADLPATAAVVADLRLVDHDEEMRATTTTGRVLVYAEDHWSLAP